MTSIYHEGERRVQLRAGLVEQADWGAQHAIRAEIPLVAGPFLAEQVLVVAGHRDAGGAAWASPLTGPAGFATVQDSRTVRLHAQPDPADALAGSLTAGPLPLGLLAIEPATRRRMRINGTAQLRDGGIELRTEQVYANCPKYITARRPAPGTTTTAARAGSGMLGGSVASSASVPPVVRSGAVDEQTADLLAATDTFFIATTHARTGADASHRGGEPGFVHVEGTRRLSWPDYPGNAMFNTLGNLELDPHAGLLLLDYRSGDVVQLTGTARTSWAPSRLREFPDAQRVVTFDVEQVLRLPARLGTRWKLQDRSPFNPPLRPRRVGTVLSVNVGQPQDVDTAAGPVRSAIWKSPVPGRVAVRLLNLDGDAQADLVGHGGEHRAVFVYQDDSYRYWQRHLGRELGGPGLFGDNLTVDGLPDDQVCIGDRYAIGDALFEVTQPRVTCHKVAVPLAEPQMPALLTGHGRPGFYLRVLREGTVAAGDTVLMIAQDPRAVTVRRTSDLLYTSEHDPDDLRRALAVPALPDGWRTSLQALLDAAGSDGNAGLAASSQPPAWAGFRPFLVESVIEQTATVRSFVLRPADGQALPQHRPGQHVSVRAQLELGQATGELEQAVSAVRSYSLAAPGDGQRLQISVKREGAVSGLLHAALRPGAALDVAAPRGTFVLDPAGDRPVALISAGIGVTPVLAMLAELARTHSARPLTWIHVARGRGEHAHAADARALFAQLPHARTLVLYTQPAPTDTPGVDHDGRGQLSAEHLRALQLPADTETFICGPASFMTDVEVALHRTGVTTIHQETFGASASTNSPRTPHRPVDEPATGIPVTFSRSGLTSRWDPARGALLDLAEACDVPVAWSCRSGVCHLCETGLVEGGVSYDPAPLDPPAAGRVLLCCSRPTAPLVLDL